MSLVIWSEMQKRHGQRCDREKESREIKLPLITDNESVSLFKKVLAGIQTKFLDACFLVTHDFKVLTAALRAVCIKSGVSIDEAIAAAWEEVRMDTETERVLSIRLSKEKPEEHPGQMKLGTVDKKGKVKDDGSKAEPASEVKTSKLEAVK